MKRAFISRRYKQLVAELRKMRQDAGLTQVQMADELDIKQTTVSKIERAEVRIDVLGFVDWCAAARTEPASILRRLRK